MEIEGIDIRQFKPEEWRVYKAVRLKALESDPKFFSAGHDESKNLPDEKWQHDLLDADMAVFGVFRHGDVIGMTGIVIDRADPAGETAADADDGQGFARGGGHFVIWRRRIK